MDHVNATPPVAVSHAPTRRGTTLAGVIFVTMLLFGCGGSDSQTPGTGSGPGITSGIPGSANPHPTGWQPPPSSEAPPSNEAQLSISGSPPTEAVVDERYSFTPQVSGGQGARNFSAQNVPRWANFDPSSGSISGTPGNSNMATYGGMRITVSDATGSATLGPFEVEVVGPGRANVTLSWQAPTERADGTPLNNLAGFRIFYGRSRNNLDTTIELRNPGLSRYVVENLRRGNWWFSMAAYDQTGLQSSRSPAVQTRL